MNVITKISCYFECSVVTLKLRKEHLNTVTYNIPVLLWIKLKSLIYRTLFYANIYGSYELSTNSSVFWPTLGGRRSKITKYPGKTQATATPLQLAFFLSPKHDIIPANSPVHFRQFRLQLVVPTTVRDLR